MRVSTQPIDRFWASDWSLSVLLIFLVISIFVLRPLEEIIGIDMRLFASLVFSAILISGVVAVSHSHRLLLVFGAVAALTVVVHWARYATAGPPWLGIEAAGAIASCGMLATIVLLHVFREGAVTVQRIQGAVAAYLLIALMFAAGYTWVDLAVPNAFTGAPPEATPHDAVQRFLYFSFVTLTTTGYGDIVPQTSAARSLSMLEALIGQMFPSILLARLVSMELWHRQRRFEREQAALDREELAREVARQLRAKPADSPR
jgi:hypothetical protein